MWNTMNKRCQKGGAYKKIEVKMTKEEWYEFVTPLIEDFLNKRPDQTPSIDRINPDGHYETSNLRIISYQENLARSRINLKRFGITKDSTETDRLEILARLFVGNCEAMEIKMSDGLEFLNERLSLIIKT